jgi:hypothetical protein
MFALASENGSDRDGMEIFSGSKSTNVLKEDDGNLLWVEE